MIIERGVLLYLDSNGGLYIFLLVEDWSAELFSLKKYIMQV